ncbi:uroporphyrinogen decarboxylase family protein [Bacteroidota bacterium]
MNSRKIVEKTLNFDSPSVIPRHLWLLPWAERKYPEYVKKIRNKYPDDIVAAPALYKKPLNISGQRYDIGKYTDEWGCCFHNIQDGVIGMVQEPLIKDWSDLESFKTPDLALNIDTELINAFCKSTNLFVHAGNITRPFERFQFIRTMELSLMDLIMEEPGFVELLKRIHEHYCKEVEVWARTKVDAVSLMDDWGTQNSLMASPEIFRKYFKPMYKDYCEIARSYGKYVFMHSDGYITEIIPDLIEVGVDALNSQVFCMDMATLNEEFSGNITFWGEIDRQNILPNGSPEDVEKAVYDVYNNLYKNGGVIAQCEFGPGAKPENIIKVFETWNTISDM